MGTSGTFEIVRTPASYIISRSGHGKWEKTGSFCILANYPDSKIFKRYSGYAIGKLTSRAFWKCGSFCCYNFLNQSNGCSKSTESEILAMLGQIRGVNKNNTFVILQIEAWNEYDLFQTLLGPQFWVWWKCSSIWTQLWIAITWQQKPHFQKALDVSFPMAYPEYLREIF